MLTGEGLGTGLGKWLVTGLGTGLGIELGTGLNIWLGTRLGTGLCTGLGTWLRTGLGTGLGTWPCKGLNTWLDYWVHEGTKAGAIYCRCRADEPPGLRVGLRRGFTAVSGIYVQPRCVNWCSSIVGQWLLKPTVCYYRYCHPRSNYLWSWFQNKSILITAHNSLHSSGSSWQLLSLSLGSHKLTSGNF